MAGSSPASHNRILSTATGRNEGSFTPGDWGRFLAVAAIWGSSFLLMDIGLDAFRPGLITFMRVGLGAAVLAATPAARRPVAARDRARIITLSLLWVAVPFTLFPVAQQWINSAVAGMLNGAMPLFAAAVATTLLRRLPGRGLGAGLLLGFAGVVAISLPSIGEGGTQALGVALVLIAVLCYGFAVNIAAPVQQAYGSVTVMAQMLAWATLWTAPWGIVEMTRSSWSWSAFVAVAVAGVIGTGVAFVVMASLVGSVGSTRAAFTTYLIPVVALILGVQFRDDHVTGVAVAGVALVIAGAILASRRDA